METHIFLASASPQRRQILQELNLHFSILPVNVEEVSLSAPGETVLANARAKAKAALKKVPANAFVLAADTIVWLHGRVVGKPKDADEARAFLREMSGEPIEAWTGMVLAKNDTSAPFENASRATAFFRTLGEEEIEWYVRTGEPLPRAGAFGMSHYGEIFVERIDGAYSCIAGLSKPALVQALRHFSILPFQ